MMMSYWLFCLWFQMAIQSDWVSVTEQTAVSAIIPVLIEWAKKHKRLTWITQNSDWVNRIVTFLLATLNTAGFSMAYQGTFETGLSLNLKIPGTEALGRVVWSVAVQELVYRNLIKRKKEELPTPQDPPADS